jgi:hypothetical protein
MSRYVRLSYYVNDVDYLSTYFTDSKSAAEALDERNSLCRLISLHKPYNVVTYVYANGNWQTNNDDIRLADILDNINTLFA